MTSMEKAELLKPAIYQMYSKEGRSKSYISRLLDINRTTIIKKIKEWNLPEPEPMRHVKPSTQKFINRNRSLIKSRLDHDISITKIAEELGVSRDFLQNSVIPNDEVLDKARNDYVTRLHTNTRDKQRMQKSYLEYNFTDLPEEIWKPILGYPGYMVSNMARVKHYASRYKKYHLIKPVPNKNNGRLYVALYYDNKVKNIQLARLVAFAFVNGYDSERNTVNHEDGNVQNCVWTNLTWQSQSENNKHAYRVLNREKVNKKRYHFKIILYKNRYEFKTVAAFAKFIGKSETQTRRYLDNPQRYDIKLIR